MMHYTLGAVIIILIININIPTWCIILLGIAAVLDAIANA